jgi:hypothetical protein
LPEWGHRRARGRLQHGWGRERASLINLIAWKFQVHTVDPTAWNSITGHRDVNQTECPGNAAYVSYQA